MFWFQILECVLLLASFIICDSKLNKVRVYSVGRPKKDIWPSLLCRGISRAHLFSILISRHGETKILPHLRL